MTPEQLSQHRKRLKQARAQLAPATQQQLSRCMVKHLQATPRYRAAKHIAIYLPVRGEADPRLLRLNAPKWQQLYLPVLSPWHKNQLIFIEWNEKTQFRNNRFNIPEPVLGSAAIRFARQLDAVITPLVGFDWQGQRMGMGGGFYDRTFAFKAAHSNSRKPYLFGFAYDFQHIPQLKSQPWDIPLDGMCTESGFKLIQS